MISTVDALIIDATLVVQTLILAWVLVRSRRQHQGSGDGQVRSATELRPHIAPEELQRMQRVTQESFERAVQESTQGFHDDLAATSQKLNQLIVRLTTDVVERELDEYRRGLTGAREQALGSLQQMQAAVQQKQKDLEADVSGELAKRQDYLIKRLDERLGAAVAAYIVESLGQGADLGAQRTFLLENLERHKEDLKKEVSGGNSTQ